MAFDKRKMSCDDYILFNVSKERSEVEFVEFRFLLTSTEEDSHHGRNSGGNPMVQLIPDLGHQY